MHLLIGLRGRLWLSEKRQASPSRSYSCRPPILPDRFSLLLEVKLFSKLWLLYFDFIVGYCSNPEPALEQALEILDWNDCKDHWQSGQNWCMMSCLSECFWRVFTWLRGSRPIPRHSRQKVWHGNDYKYRIRASKLIIREIPKDNSLLISTAYKGKERPAAPPLLSFSTKS